jgi:hypothetical protein
MRKTVICPALYFPPVSLFATMATAGELKLEAHEHYQKGSYRNRCYIAGPNGVLRLSVPLLKGKHEQLPVRYTLIAYHDDWPRHHWQSLRTAYGNAPFFEYYADRIKAVLFDRPATLWDLNTAMLRVLLDYWSLPPALAFTDTYRFDYEPGTEDLRNRVDTGGPLPASWKPVAYPQVFEEKNGFLENLSVLDLLFCTGPEGRRILFEMAD